MQRIVLATVLLAQTACGSAPVRPELAGSGDRTVLTSVEIEAAQSPGSNAYELLAQLRPEFLKSRGSISMRNTSPATAMVYLNGFLFGTLQSLRTISAEPIVHVEYINAADATTRFGTNHGGGAILIKTK